MNLTLVDLFPEQLCTAGDIGNIICLEQRARWRGIETTVVSLRPGDSWPAPVDLVHIGSGPEYMLRELQPHVLALAPQLRAAAARNIPLLAISGGWQLLSQSFSPAGGEDKQAEELLPGAGVYPQRCLPASWQVGEQTLRPAAELSRRLTTAEKESLPPKIVGYMNCGFTAAESSPRPPGEYALGRDGKNRWHGYIAGNLLACCLHGALLPLNPGLADLLLRAAWERRYGSEALPSFTESGGARAEQADRLAEKSAERFREAP